MQKKIKATTQQNGQRLDKFLTEKLKDISRSQIKKMILHNQILVNGKKSSVHHFLRENDLITLVEEKKKKAVKIPKIKIIKEASDFLAIEKPAGLLAHSAPGKNEPSLTDWIKQNVSSSKILSEQYRYGIVHRLDKLTSGVLLVAKTEAMYEHLKKQFRNKLVHKTYLALVHGHLPHEQGEIKAPIGRSKNNTRMAARAHNLDEKDKSAKTKYEVIKRYQKFDYINVMPLTGRTHQIRVHLQSLGHPIVGDNIYTIHKQKEIIDLGRYFLHATQITFNDIDGNQITIKSHLPHKLKTFLKKLII